MKLDLGYVHIYNFYCKTVLFGTNKWYIPNGLQYIKYYEQ